MKLNPYSEFLYFLYNFYYLTCILRKWVTNCIFSVFFNYVWNFSEFLCLTYYFQEVTRAHKGWALDGVVLHNDVTRQMKDDITTPPSEGVYVYGLFLEGAGWDKRGSKLIEPKPKVLFEPMPVIHIYAINTTSDKEDTRMYKCPIYKKPRRTDLTYIAAVFLKTNQNPDHWVLRGVALLCDIK